jgi:hypothetical protein
LVLNSVVGVEHPESNKADIAKSKTFLFMADVF